MLKIQPEVMARIAAQNGWTYDRGIRAGTINATAMAEALGVSTSTITRAYNEGSTGLHLVDKLNEISGVSFDELLRRAA